MYIKQRTKKTVQSRGPQEAPSQSRQEINSRAPAWRPGRPLAARHAIGGREVMAGEKPSSLGSGFVLRREGIYSWGLFDCLGFKEGKRARGRTGGLAGLEQGEGEEELPAGEQEVRSGARHLRVTRLTSGVGHVNYRSEDSPRGKYTPLNFLPHEPVIINNLARFPAGY